MTSKRRMTTRSKSDTSDIEIDDVDELKRLIREKEAVIKELEQAVRKREIALMFINARLTDIRRELKPDIDTD